MKYRFALVLPILALAGCAALDQVAKDIQKATAPVMVTETLPQICQAAKKNRYRPIAFMSARVWPRLARCVRSTKGSSPTTGCS